VMAVMLRDDGPRRVSPQYHLRWIACHRITVIADHSSRSEIVNYRSRDQFEHQIAAF
jgi:hypothetical protein